MSAAIPNKIVLSAGTPCACGGEIPPGPKAHMHSGMPLKKGVTGRFGSAFSHSEQELCVQKFTPWLERMGYLP
jgi:hypothetical protein